MRNSCRRNHQHSRARLFFFAANCKPSAALQDEIELVRSLMSMDVLSLAGLQTVKTNQRVFALPQSGLVKLLRLRSGVVLPVEKVVHLRFLHLFGGMPKLTQAGVTMKRLPLALARAYILGNSLECADWSALWSSAA